MARERKGCKLVCYISKYDIVKYYFFISVKQSNKYTIYFVDYF